MNNLTPTKIENAIEFITFLTEENDHFNAVVALAFAFGTKAQHMDAREITELYLRDEVNPDLTLRELYTRRELVKTQILLSIAEKDVALYRRVAQAF